MKLDSNSCRQLLSTTCRFNRATHKHGILGAVHLFALGLCMYPILSLKLFDFNLFRNEQMFHRYLNYLKVHEDMKMNRRADPIHSGQRKGWSVVPKLKDLREFMLETDSRIFHTCQPVNKPPSELIVNDKTKMVGFSSSSGHKSTHLERRWYLLWKNRPKATTCLLSHTLTGPTKSGAPCLVASPF